MQCPNCGASTAQAPNGSWYCPNCGWSSGYAPDPLAIAWLEEESSVSAYITHPNGSTSWRRDLFDGEHDFRGGSLGKLFSFKDDHGFKGVCVDCRIAASHDQLIVVG